MFQFFRLGMSLLPKNLISFCVGCVVRVRLPRPLQARANQIFARMFKIDESAAEHGLSHYCSIEEVFVRKLKPGLRPIDGDLVSPADGFLARSGPIEGGNLIQAKGIGYSAQELVFGPASTAAAPNLGWYLTVYLAPHNYHRVHLPLSGNLTSIRYIPGELWPVNTPFARNFMRLFCRNERLTFDFVRPDGGKFHVVMVGAMNVGRIRTHLLPDFVTNGARRQLGAQPKEFPFSLTKPMAAGDELGVFMLGSTVVLILDDLVLKTHRPAVAGSNAAILMGQSLRG